jgi:lipopolysaccharide/colanic/teichoic acid biosynthesis glycosyltransferase
VRLSGCLFDTRPDERSWPARLAKRGLDLVVSAACLLLSLPVMLVIAIVVRLDSPGPVFVGQERVGRGLRTFRMYKFRSMIPGADLLQTELWPLNDATPPQFKLRRDPRLTRVGRVLRRRSLDELPQLYNVLRGDMSLVGPRPPILQEVRADYLRQLHRLRSRPGITGPWQVSGRSLLDYEQMVSLDLRYEREWSFWEDVAILARTVPAVLTGRGAF